MKIQCRYVAAGVIGALLLTFSNCQPKASKVQQPHNPEIHAHRGGAAEYPENTIPAMLHAVSIGVPVLEMDLHITRDSQVVVSHDPYLNAAKILKPDSSRIPADEERMHALYTLTYDSLKQYDAGSLLNPLYPQRKQVKCHIPLLSELIDSVETYTALHHIRPVKYNIEIKSGPEKDHTYSPDYRTFTDLCMKELLHKQLGDRLIIQSFDTRTLNYLHEKYPYVRLSYLIEPEEGVDFEAQLKRLTFIPPIISPQYTMVNEKFIQQAARHAMQVIPWTVDDREEVNRLVRLGVDAIITNGPSAVMQQFASPKPQ